jgi:hypothetical protein
VAERTLREQIIEHMGADGINAAADDMLDDLIDQATRASSPPSSPSRVDAAAIIEHGERTIQAISEQRGVGDYGGDHGDRT